MINFTMGCPAVGDKFYKVLEDKYGRLEMGEFVVDKVDGLSYMCSRLNAEPMTLWGDWNDFHAKSASQAIAQYGKNVINRYRNDLERINKFRDQYFSYLEKDEEYV